MPSQTRNYYEHLFTPDSASDNSYTTTDRDVFTTHNLLNDLISQGNSILNDKAIFPHFVTFRCDDVTQF